MATTLPAVITPSEVPAVRQEDHDRDLISAWVRQSQSPNTRENYRRQAGRFMEAMAKPLAQVRMSDLQNYLADMADQAPATRANATAILKSLFTFAYEVNYISTNIGKVVKAPSVKNTLAERIMTEADTMRLIALEPNARNRALLTLTYGAGLRISEVADLKWEDLIERDGGAGQANVHGKGGKTRTILLSANTWQTVRAIRGSAGPKMSVFRSRQADERGDSLGRSQVHRLVKAATKRAGLSSNVSMHWLRHAHASHSLDRGAPIHLVQATLGHASVATTGRYTHARPSDSSARYLGI